jgi:3-hydroxyacyl-CoA dehydrogenase
VVPMNDIVRVTHDGPVAVVHLNNPPVNALSRAVRTALFEVLERLVHDAAVGAVVVAGAGRCFSAGADVGEFQDPDPDKMLGGRDPLAITALMDDSAKPIVAAIHGFVFGGGLELALGAHARVCSPDAQLGLPEIQLGVLPGAGGTQRLPRLIGFARAADMMLTGKPVKASVALADGLVDEVVRGDLIEGAIAHARRLMADPGKGRRARDLSKPARPAEGAWTPAVPKRAMAFAAARINECLDAATRLQFDAALRFEREAFLSCNASPQAAALQHGFFAQREAARVPDLPADVRPRAVRDIAVVGGGTMGRGIAMAIANAGLPVCIVEADAQRADAAAQAIRADYERQGAAGRLSSEQVTQRIARVTTTAGDEVLGRCDLVIEAVFEDLAIKRSLCQRLGRLCKPGAIIASNTSTLDIDVLAAASGRPADVIGLHFFSPANVMRLLEIVRGRDTAPDVLATALWLARQLGKDPVVCRVCYGFIGNRMLEPYLRETEALLLEGATPRQIDESMEAFGMAMGPCRMLDLAGVDVAAKVVIERDKQGALPADPLYRIVCRALADAGRHGQKTGAGFYRYEGRKAVDDPAAIELIRALAVEHGVQLRGDISADEIVDRCLLPLINEGLLILEEGIAIRPGDIDVVWLSGYGFPAERGGPMFYASTMGLGQIGARLQQQAARSGDAHGYWRPAFTLANAA